MIEENIPHTNISVRRMMELLDLEDIAERNTKNDLYTGHKLMTNNNHNDAVFYFNRAKRFEKIAEKCKDRILNNG